MVESLATIPDDDEEAATVPPTSSVTNTKTNVETTQESLSKKENGAIFGYLIMPIVLAGTMNHSMHLYVFLRYHAWSFISSIYLVPDNEDIIRNDDESKFGKIFLSIHALMAVSVVLLTFYQLFSGLSITLAKVKTETLSRRIHRANGRLTAGLWFFAIVTGVIYTNASDRIREGERSRGGLPNLVTFNVVLHVAAVAMLINLYNGISTVLKPNKEDRDYILHKGSMFFVIYWIGFTWISNFVCQILQVTVLNDCRIHGGPLLVFMGTILGTIEYCVYVSCGLRYGGQAFRRPFVQYNFMAMAVQLLVFWGALFVQAVTRSDQEDDVTCFTTGVIQF